MLVEDELDAERMALLAQKVKVVLELANQDELNFEYVRNIIGHNFGKVQIHTFFW